MTKIDREARAKRIVSFYESVANNSKFLTYQHFKIEGISKSTIYYIINKYEKYGCYEDMHRSGRPPKMNKKKVKRLSKIVNNSSGIGQRDLGRQFNVCQTTISYTLRNKTDIKCWKKEKTPAYNDNQEARVIIACRRLVTKTFAGKDIVVDDEKYFCLSNWEIPGNNIYYTSDKRTAPPEIKYKQKTKFEDKVLVWAALSSNGCSKLFINKSCNAINSDVYIKECLTKRLLPFLSAKHADNNYVFWPDLASSHYAKNTQEWLIANNIEFVEKVKNPPNVPQLDQ